MCSSGFEPTDLAEGYGQIGAENYVLATAARGPVQQRNGQREFAKAKQAAGLDSVEGRLSWHSLPHSAGSIWLTQYGEQPTTVSKLMGRSYPAFTLACYGRDPRDTETMVGGVSARAAVVGTRLQPHYRSRSGEHERRTLSTKSPDYRVFW